MSIPAVAARGRRRWIPTAARPADLALAGWVLLWCGLYAWGGGLAWHFFVQGARALGDGDDRLTGGLHLYAGLPQLQIGPLALLATRLLSPGGPGLSLRLAQVAGVLAGLAVIVLAGRLARWARPDQPAALVARRLRLAAVFFLPAWLYLAVASVHLDDVLALLCGLAGVAAAVRRRPVLAGLLLGLAADAKPWALPFAAILLLLPGWRARLAGAGALAATVAVAWLPFVLADPRSVNAARFTIANTAYTALRVLGVHSPRTPVWDRPAQAMLGLALAALAVRRGRWVAVPLVVVASRVVLDPGTNLYYVAGVAVGAMLVDTAGSGVPWWTASAVLALLAARKLPLPPHVDGALTLTYFLATVVYAVAPVGPGRREGGGDESGTGGPAGRAGAVRAAGRPVDGGGGAAGGGAGGVGR